MPDDILTPEQQYVLSLEQAVANAKLLLDRLTAMEKAGVLSSAAAESVDGWRQRLLATHSNLPSKPQSLMTAQEIASHA